jgi:hypothetical protein
LQKNNNKYFNDYEMDLKIQKLIDDLFFKGSSNKIFIITAFESTNEVNMKNYLLKNHKRLSISGGKYWIIHKN